MASGFHVSEACEETGCRAESGALYYVAEKKSLCDGCALKHGCILPPDLGLELLCEEHYEPIKLYCWAHDQGICQVCALVDHKDASCTVKYMEDAKKELKEQLLNRKDDVVRKIASWREYKQWVAEGRLAVDQHLTSVKDEINTAVDEAIDEENGKEQEDIAEVNRKADEEIRKINEKRYAAIETIERDAKKRRDPIEEKRRQHLGDVEVINNKVDTKISKITETSEDIILTLEEAAPKMDDRLKDEKGILIKGTRAIVAGTQTALEKNAEKTGMERLVHAVKDVRFLKGVGTKTYKGRVDGLEGEWALTKSLPCPAEIKSPRLVGCLEEDCLLSEQCATGHIYLMNLKYASVIKIKVSKKAMVSSVAAFGESKAVLGSALHSKNESRISVFDRQWNMIKDIAVLPHTTAWVDVVVDKKGMIITGLDSRPHIKVFDPEDGRLVQTLVCRNPIRMLGILSNGNIIARFSPPARKLLIIDRSGGQQEIPHEEEVWHCAVDPLTDALYVVTSGPDGGSCAIHELRGTNYEVRRRVGAFPLPTKLRDCKTQLWISSIQATPAGNLIICNYDSILVYKKQFCL